MAAWPPQYELKRHEMTPAGRGYESLSYHTVAPKYLQITTLIINTSNLVQFFALC